MKTSTGPKTPQEITQALIDCDAQATARERERLLADINGLLKANPSMNAREFLAVIERRVKDPRSGE
jgi:hypothetical protein